MSFNLRKVRSSLWLAFGLLIIAATCACGFKFPPLPPGTVCPPNSNACNCFVPLHADDGTLTWAYRPCPVPTPSPTPTPVPQPSPTPSASPTPQPTPTPSTSPTPGPTPTPGTCPASCDQIELCGIGAQVHQFQNRQAQTVPYHREGDGGFIYVPNGPVLGGKVQTDQTPYYKPKVNPPGGCGPRFSCNGEGEFWGHCCEACERPGVWSQVSGPHLDFVLYNNGFGIDARLTEPGYYEFKTCGGSVCKLIAWRITQ